MKIEKVGTNYAFAFVPENLINRNSIVYSFGAGLELHWDIEMIRKYNCNVFIFDPTPKSASHFNELCSNTLKGENSFSDLKLPYNATKEIIDKMKFYEFALWKEDNKVKFFEPLDSEHISHSIVDRQETGKFIEVEARKLGSISDLLKHSKIDYLKLDIEGAEYDVIDSIIDDKINVEFFYIEFHYSSSISAIKNIIKINKSLEKIQSKGYKLVHGYKGRYFSLKKI